MYNLVRIDYHKKKTIISIKSARKQIFSMLFLSILPSSSNFLRTIIYNLYSNNITTRFQKKELFDVFVPLKKKRSGLALTLRYSCDISTSTLNFITFTENVGPVNRSVLLLYLHVQWRNKASITGAPKQKINVLYDFSFNL